MLERQPIILHSIRSGEAKNNQTDPSTDKQFGLHAKVKLHVQFFWQQAKFCNTFYLLFFILALQMNLL